ICPGSFLHRREGFSRNPSHRRQCRIGRLRRTRWDLACSLVTSFAGQGGVDAVNYLHRVVSRHSLARVQRKKMTRRAQRLNQHAGDRMRAGRSQAATVFALSNETAAALATGCVRLGGRVRSTGKERLENVGLLHDAPPSSPAGYRIWEHCVEARHGRLECSYVIGFYTLCLHYRRSKDGLPRITVRITLAGLAAAAAFGQIGGRSRGGDGDRALVAPLTLLCIPIIVVAAARSIAARALRNLEQRAHINLLAHFPSPCATWARSAGADAPTWL